MANEIKNHLNGLANVRVDWKEDWKETTKSITTGAGAGQLAKPDFAADTGTPVNTVAPAITGTAQVGQTLTVTNGTWTGTATVAYTRQWYRGTVKINGAEGLTYTPVAADVGKVLTVKVRAVNTKGTASIVSNATTAIIA